MKWKRFRDCQLHTGHITFSLEGRGHLESTHIHYSNNNCQYKRPWKGLPPPFCDRGGGCSHSSCPPLLCWRRRLSVIMGPIGPYLHEGNRGHEVALGMSGGQYRGQTGVLDPLASLTPPPPPPESDMISTEQCSHFPCMPVLSSWCMVCTTLHVQCYGPPEAGGGNLTRSSSYGKRE